MDKKTISYTGVILDEPSRAKLLSFMDWMIPKSYKRIAHHMTVNMGPYDTKFNKPEHLGKIIGLVAHSWSMDNRVAAVKVDILTRDFKTINHHPHVTLAVNQAEGKAVQSNELTNWTALPWQIGLQGPLVEVESDPAPKPQ